MYSPEVEKLNNVLNEKANKAFDQGMLAKSCTDAPCKVTLLEQLQNRYNRAMHEADRLDRAITILREHPEFEAYEDFKDLLRHKDW